MESKYWAVEDDLKKLGQNLVQKVQDFENFVRESGLYSLWASMHRHYHGVDRDGFTSHEIANKGDDGELAVFHQNFLREMLTHYRTLAQGQRAAMEPVAIDEDYESELQKIRGKAVLEDADRSAGLEKKRNLVAEYGAVYGSGTLRQRWNSMGGEKVMPGDLSSVIPSDEADNGLSEDETSLSMSVEPNPETVAALVEQQLAAGPMEEAPPEQPEPDIFEGALEADIFLPPDVIIDTTRRDDNHQWWILRTRRNRWDLAAEYGKTVEMRQKLASHTDPTPTDSRTLDLRRELWMMQAFALRMESPDEVEVFEFWHSRSPACPNGKRVYFLSDGTVLEVGDLGPLRRPPIRTLAPGSIIGTPFHYTPGFDLLSPQEALNMLQSIALTNERAHGVGIILMPQGSNLVAEEIGTGLAICEYVGGLGEPKALNFTNTPSEVFENQDRIQDGMQKTIGINGTIRGDPEANLKSGSALVFVQSQAVQFASNFQNDIIGFYEGSASDTIEIHQHFMTAEKTWRLLGEQDAIELLSFSGAGLDRLVRVRIEVVNPMMNTLAGRSQIADGMIEKYGPEVIPPDRYFRMLLTGRFEPVTRESEKKLSNAKKMCQLLAQGIGIEPRMPGMDKMGQPTMQPAGEPGVNYVRPLATDDHRFMIQQAISVLNSPSARANEKVVQAVLGVVREHVSLLSELTMNFPQLLEATGQMPLQSALLGGMPGALPGMGPGGPPGPGGGGPPEPGGPQKALEPGIDNSPPGPGQPPKMPQMPRAPEVGKKPGEPNLVGQRL